MKTFDVPGFCDAWIGRIETFIGVGWAKRGNFGPGEKKAKTGYYIKEYRPELVIFEAENLHNNNTNDFPL